MTSGSKRTNRRLFADREGDMHDPLEVAESLDSLGDHSKAGIDESLYAAADVVRALAAEHAAVLALDTPFPLVEVLKRLADGVDHLLGDHACDLHGHEGLRCANDAAREMIKILEGVT